MHARKERTARGHVSAWIFEFGASTPPLALAGYRYLMMQHRHSHKGLRSRPPSNMAYSVIGGVLDAHLPDGLTSCPAHRLAPVARTVLTWRRCHVVKAERARNHVVDAILQPTTWFLLWCVRAATVMPGNVQCVIARAGQWMPFNIFNTT